MKNNENITTAEKLELMEAEIKRGITGEKKKNAGSRILNALFILAVIVLLSIIFVVMRAKITGNVPTVFTYQFFRVETGSMKPTFEIGDIIICKKTDDVSALKEGDIVTFHSGENLITHRIIEVVTDEYGNVLYRTKGDNPNNDPDLMLLSPANIESVFVKKL